MAHRLLALTIGALLTAGVAHADPVRPADPLAARVLMSAAPAPGAPVLLPYARQAQTPLPEGVARTSVEKRFADRDDTVGEAGFLCGLMPHANTSGVADAHGHDPEGRFVGTKLRMAF